MDVAELVETYPRLSHMAESGSWPGIRRHGLLSTSALLDLFGVDGDRRTRLESARRPVSVIIRHPIHGTAVFRDQIPLRESPLEQCLLGMTPGEWYRELNFFWLDEERVGRLLRACLPAASVRCPGHRAGRVWPSRVAATLGRWIGDPCAHE